MSRVQSDKRTFKMQTGCLSRQVVVATDGDLSRISRRISRAHSLGTMEAGRLSGWPRAKKKEKNQFTAYLQFLARYLFFGRTGFARLLVAGNYIFAQICVIAATRSERINPGRVCFPRVQFCRSRYENVAWPWLVT